MSCKNSNIDCISAAQVRQNTKDYLTQTLLILAGVDLKDKLLLEKTELTHLF